MTDSETTPPFHEPAVTPTAVVQTDADDIVHLLMIPGHRTAEQVNETLAVLEHLVGDAHILLAVDVLPLATIEETAFDIVARSPFLRQIRAIAFVGDPADTDLLRPTLQRTRSAHQTVGIFDSSSAARAWLLSFKDDL